MEDMTQPPPTIREIIANLQRFDPNTTLKVETYVEDGGFCSADVVDIGSWTAGVPVLIVGVTAEEYKNRLEELRQKLESQEAKE